jgi:RNA polymerase sigma-70 factor (ECF subfamily)
MQEAGAVTGTISEDLVVPLAVQRTRARLEDLETVVRLYRGQIFRFLMMSLRDAEVADTLTQDCFMKAYGSRNAFRGDCSLDTWLMRVAVNLLRDHARNRKLQFWRRASASSVDIADITERIAMCESDPEEALISREQLGLVWKAAERLPSRQKEVFLLRFLEDKSVEEIAAITGTAEKTVKSHLYRAVGCIRAEVGGAK